MKQKKQSPLRSQKSLPGPDDVTRVTLSNGIVVLVRANFNSPSIVVGGYLPCGSLFDSDEKLGLADFTASSLLRGTEKRDFKQIFEDLESTGASLSFGSGTHTAGFTGRCLAEDLPLLLNLLSEALRSPVFPDTQIERLRAQFLTGLALRAQDTAEMASITFDKMIFAGHPYGRPDEGYPETIQAITRSDMLSFHQQAYGPRGMVLALVGAVEPEKALEQVTQALGDWTNPGQLEVPPLPALKILEKRLTRKVKIAGKSQADIVIGAYGPTRKSPEFMPASLANSILGQFGLGGRIAEVVRERSGLAYSSSSSLNAGVGPGSWDVSAGVNPANINRTRDLIIDEITRFIEEGVTVGELDDSKSNFIGRLPLSLESNAGVVNALLNIERYDLGLDYYRHYPDLVGKATAEEILVIARKYLQPEKLAIAIAGP